jgi:putative endonuclease
MFYVYFIKSLKNGKYYVGSTDRLPKDRLAEHNRGMNQWTKQNGPFELTYYEMYICKEDAKLREKFYKSGFGRKIKSIIIKEVASAKGGSASG